MPVVGTAGHVDHGKSTLIRALTGRETDRWEEEQRRGLTIDLGFAWTTLEDGTEVSFVDVPGHERFIKNMLAGIEAIDVALFVVAADEGWMPQSEEHLAVLDLLGVSRGVVALTKVDRVDAELAELAALEVEEHLAGTGLEGAPIVPVAAPEGRGVEEVRAALARRLVDVAPDDDDRPRLWVDRAFTITGAGTVVTGTLLGGHLVVGDEVEVWPGPQPARVRSLQTHERDTDRVDPGRRVAINLAGLAREDLERGAMLGLPGQWRPAHRLAVTLTPARYVDELTNRGAYHLHLGSGAWAVTLRMVEEDLAYIDLPVPLCVEIGDRFILRETGRRLVVGGGRVLAPDPPRPGRFPAELRAALRASLDDAPSVRAEALLALRGREHLDRLAAVTGGGRPPGAVVVGTVALHPDESTRLTGRLRQLVADHQERHPLRPGLPLAEAAERLAVDHGLATSLAEADPELVVEGSVVRTAGFTGGRSDAQEEGWQAARQRMEEAGATEALRASELGLSEELLHALAREEAVVRIGEFVYLPEHLEELVGVIRSFSNPFTVSEFRERAGISRKYAVPLLEWADRQGITVRMGDRRRLR